MTSWHRSQLDAAASLAAYWGATLAPTGVCRDHTTPLEFLRQQIFERPSLSLWCGPRGGGKSFISGLGTHVNCMGRDRYGSRILGGSLSQSEQIYTALNAFGLQRPGRRPARITKRSARYVTRSEVAILAASPTSVRGPHVQELKLDEVDEIDPDIRESAFGMCMELHGVSASVVMTSTWHRIAGPMAELMAKGRAGAFPVHTFCIFEVLERCPDARSGRRLERCPDCPLMPWCHADRDAHPSGLPKAKRSSGHYGIDALVQKLHGVSLRVFNSDYMCAGPKADGVWFKDFDDAGNVAESAEYDPALPVHVSVDSGVFTAAVLFQVRDTGAGPLVTAFGDYLSEDVGAEGAALQILELIEVLCPDARRFVSTDSAGGARNPVGPTVFAEYDRAGLVGERGRATWPKYPGCVLDGLKLIEPLVKAADGTRALVLHPRCSHLKAALMGYRRARVGGQWQEYPADPQHPEEDLVDALRGGLMLALPDGLARPYSGPTVDVGSIW